jgi:hypothetical protein
MALVPAGRLVRSVAQNRLEERKDKRGNDKI